MPNDHEMQHADSPTWCVHCGTFDIYCQSYPCEGKRERKYDSALNGSARIVRLSDPLQCRFCGLTCDPQEMTFVNSYWLVGGSVIESYEHRGNFISVADEPKFVCHRSCKKPGFAAEALACQTIDADCNDCKHFKRGKYVEKPAHPGTENLRTDDQQLVYLKALTVSQMWVGDCLKFDEPTVAHPVHFTGKPCFEHRRSVMPNESKRRFEKGEK